MTGRPRSRRMEDVLSAIREAVVKGAPPTIGELRQTLGLGSTRTVLRYLRWLEAEGAIERWPGARGIRLIGLSQEHADLIRSHERGACAALVRAAGCICEDLYPESCAATFKKKGGGSYGFEELEVAVHDPRCPQYLADEIERGMRESDVSRETFQKEEV